MTTNVAVLGLGYVGLALAREACLADLSVLGFGVQPAVVHGLNGGRSNLQVSLTDIRSFTAGCQRRPDPVGPRTRRRGDPRADATLHGGQPRATRRRVRDRDHRRQSGSPDRRWQCVGALTWQLPMIPVYEKPPTQILHHSDIGTAR
jgi:hypothetical protein